MAAVSGVVRPVMKAEVANIPVGKAAVITVAMGIGDVAKALITKFSGDKVPTWLVGLGIAWALVNTRAIRNLLGADVSELAALGIVADTINDQFDLRQRTSDLLSGLFGGQTISESPPQFISGQGTVTRQPVSAARTGDIYGGIF